MTSVLRLENRFGQGLFSVAGDLLLERYPQLMDYVPSNDKGLNEFMDSIEAAGKQRGLRHYLKFAFNNFKDPEFRRAQLSNWVFGFVGYDQLCVMFNDAAVFGIMRKNGIRLNEYKVGEADVYLAHNQVLFYKPGAIKIEQRELHTGEVIDRPVSRVSFIRNILNPTPRCGP